LVFAAIFIIPPQPWVELQFKHDYAASYGHFWASDYFRFGTLKGIVLPTWQHLWFVAYLWVYTLVLALLLMVVPARVRAKLGALADRALGGPLILIMPIVLLLVHLWISWPGQEETHMLVDDWLAHRIYFAVFLFGFFLRHAERTWAGIREWWKVAAAAAVLGFVPVAAIHLGLYRPPTAEPVFEVARIFQGWGTTVALIGLADRYWNRDHKLRPMLTEAVFPFYIIHQTIIVVVGWYLLPLVLPTAAEFAILVAATVAGCGGFYLAGREVPLLRPLIGLQLARAERPAREAGQSQGAP
jgi:peptidoglycan/LPS O-acetylase OafA/YrhL